MTWAPVQLHFMLSDRYFDVPRVFRICIARLYGQLIVLLLLHSIKHLNKTFYTYGRRQFFVWTISQAGADVRSDALSASTEIVDNC